VDGATAFNSLCVRLSDGRRGVGCTRIRSSGFVNSGGNRRRFLRPERLDWQEKSRTVTSSSTAALSNPFCLKRVNLDAFGPCGV
jgi:hypothetical protein